jgi:ATP-dependent helicase/nuclease subunit B
MPVLLTKNLRRPAASLDGEADAFLRRGDGSFLYVAPTRRKLRDLQREFLSRVPGGIAPAFHLFTLETLAAKLCAILFPPKRFVSGPVQAVLVNEAILAVEPSLKYFRMRSGRRRMPRGTFHKIISVLNSLKEQGVYRTSLLAEIEAAEENEFPKLQDLLLVSEAYEEILGSRFIDAGGLFQQLNLEWDPARAEPAFRRHFPGVSTLLVTGFDEFSDPELTMLYHLSELSGMSTVVSFDYHLENEEVFGHLRENYRKLLSMGFAKTVAPGGQPGTFADHVARHLFTREFAGTRFPCRSEVTLLSAADRQEEVELIAKAIKRLVRDRPERDLSRICVAMYKPERYTNLFREVFERFGIPANITDRYYLDQSPLVIAVLSFLAVKQRNFRLTDIMRALSSPYLDLGAFGGALDPGNLYDVATKLKISSGRSAWRTFIADRLAKVGELLADESDEIESAVLRREEASLRKAAADTDAIEAMLAPFAERMSPTEFRERVLGLLSSLGVVERLLAVPPEAIGMEHLEKDSRAYQKFLTFLDDFLEILALERHRDERETLGFYLDRLRVALSQVRYNVRQRYGYGVSVTSFDETRGIAADVMMIAGLVDGEFPPVYQPEIFYSAARRERKERYHLHEHRYLFYQAVTNFTEHLFLSYPRSEGDAELVPSSFLHGIVEIADLNDRRGDPLEEYRAFSYSPDDLVQRLGASIAHSLEEGREPVFPDYATGEIARTLAQMRRAIPVEQGRAAGDPAPVYGGLIGEAAAPEVRAALEKFRQHVFSVTQLESYGSCPFQFFADKVLRLNGVAELEEGLSAIERGGLLHQILFEFYVDRRERGLPPLFEEDDAGFRRALEEARTRAGAKLREWNITDVFWDVDQELILGTNRRKGLLQEFLEHERARTLDVRPSYFEVGFGSRTGKISDPALGRKEPVMAGSVALRGKVDRIDADADGRFAIIDYKTGSRLAGRKEIDEGISVQIPLYLYAVEEVLAAGAAGRRPAGVAGTYYTLRSPVGEKLALGSAEHWEKAFNVGKKSNGCVPTDEELKAVIARTIEFVNGYVDGIAGGNFPVRPKHPEQVCAYCAFNSVCRIKTQIAIQEEEE